MSGKRIGFFLGLVAFIIMLLLPCPDGMKIEAWRLAAVTVLMAVWWITEALPIPATSLIPIALYPLLHIMNAKKVTVTYADEVVFLFMGGFFLAKTMERWNLHRRVALFTISLVGASPSHMVLGFMVATGFLSMWISNTACAVMMVPIGIAVISQVLDVSKSEAAHDPKHVSNFAKALMLGIAYAASIGGVATLIGTPPNAIMKSAVKTMYNIDINFGQWMMIGLPIALIMGLFVWVLLTKVLFRTGNLKLAGSKEVIHAEREKLGPMSRPEILTLCVGVFMALFWISRGFLVKRIDLISLTSDTTVAIIGAMLLFILPADIKKGTKLLDWDTAIKIPWGILLLFGAGITIASGFGQTDLAGWVSLKLQELNGVSIVVFVLVIATLTTFLTEVTSNTATANLLVPIVGATAIAIGVHPFAGIIAACVSASFAFMLPVATPPNAVVFGSGHLQIKDMVYAGVVLNIFGAILITVIITYLMPVMWGIDMTSVPADVTLFMEQQKAAAEAAAALAQ